MTMGLTLARPQQGTRGTEIRARVWPYTPAWSWRISKAVRLLPIGRLVGNLQERIGQVELRGIA